jgi:hypothetical protein
VDIANYSNIIHSFFHFFYVEVVNYENFGLAEVVVNYENFGLIFFAAALLIVI